MAAARKAAHSIRLENRRRLLPNRYIHPSGVAICIEESKKSQRNIIGIFASCGKDCDIRLVLSHVA